MARKRRNNNARGSRNWGAESGVTITTSPSGVTIYKNKVETTDGYMGAFLTTGLLIATGTTTITGNADGQTFTGITTINQVMATPCVDKSAVTPYNVVVSGNVAWLTSGVTEVDVNVYDMSGGTSPPVLSTSAVSIHYMVFGT